MVRDHEAGCMQALVLLEHIQRKRKKTSGLRLAAAALNSILDVPLEASKQLAELDIKHIQHDTLSGYQHLLGLCDIHHLSLTCLSPNLARGIRPANDPKVYRLCPVQSQVEGIL
jgi:hypothetical protein